MRRGGEGGEGGDSKPEVGVELVSSFWKWIPCAVTNSDSFTLEKEFVFLWIVVVVVVVVVVGEFDRVVGFEFEEVITFVEGLKEDGWEIIEGEFRWSIVPVCCWSCCADSFDGDDWTVNSFEFCSWVTVWFEAFWFWSWFRFWSWLRFWCWSKDWFDWSCCDWSCCVGLGFWNFVWNKSWLK